MSQQVEFTLKLLDLDYLNMIYSDSESKRHRSHTSRKKKKKRRKRSKSKSQQSVHETGEKLEDLSLKDIELLNDAEMNLESATHPPRFYVSEERPRVLEDGRCEECLMDCGKTRTRNPSLKQPFDFRSQIIGIKKFQNIPNFSIIAALFSKMTSQWRERTRRQLQTLRNQSELRRESGSKIKSRKYREDTQVRERPKKSSKALQKGTTEC